MQDSQSTSQFIFSELDISRSFSELSEIKTEGFNRLVKAKRYGKWYLLKGLKTAYSNQSLYQELLRKEFEISISLDHPNIVRTIGLEEVEGLGLCIIFEFIEGRTLQTYLTEKHSGAEKRKLAQELLEALAYVHSKQIVHRDIKPANILVTGNGNNLKLIDFGLADTDAHAILKQPAGTERYSSPEQKTEAEADCRNDIYSLGKILLELHAGALYTYVGKRCLKEITHRYRSIHAIEKVFKTYQQIGRIGSYVLLSMVIVVPAVLLINQYTLQANKNSVHERIAFGKEQIVSVINQPLQQCMDTVTIPMSEASSLHFDLLIKERNQAITHLLDSLTTDVDEYDKQLIKDAIQIFSAEHTPTFEANRSLQAM